LYQPPSHIDIQKLLKGTTTVGLVTKDAVILAADKRATAGYYIAHKRVRKILRVDDRIAITTAGLVADAQMLVSWIQNEIKYYKLTLGRPISVKTVASILSLILHSSRYFPYIVQLLVGGYDTAPRLYMLEFFGAITEEKYTATGSGSPIAIGVIEGGYNPEMSIEDAVQLAVKAVKSAMSRDSASGEGVDIVVITKDKYEERSIK